MRYAICHALCMQWIFVSVFHMFVVTVWHFIYNSVTFLLLDLLKNKAVVDIILRPRCWNTLYGALWEQMTSSTKPEGHNVLRFCQRRTEPRQLATFRKNVAKIDHVVLEISVRSHIQTCSSLYCAPLAGWNKTIIYDTIRYDTIRLF